MIMEIDEIETAYRCIDRLNSILTRYSLKIVLPDLDNYKDRYVELQLTHSDGIKTYSTCSTVSTIWVWRSCNEFLLYHSNIFSLFDVIQYSLHIPFPLHYQSAAVSALTQLKSLSLNTLRCCSYDELLIKMDLLGL